MDSRQESSHDTIVLLIDPDHAEANRLQHLLPASRDGHALVESTAAVADGLERLSQGGVLAVLLRLSQRQDQGFAREAVVKLRTKAHDVPIIPLVTADEEFLAMQAIQIGAYDYLVLEHLDSHTLLRTPSGSSSSTSGRSGSLSDRWAKCRRIKPTCRRSSKAKPTV